MHNTNAAKRNDVGATKRSAAKSGLVPKGTLGAFIVRDLADGKEFSIGTGIGLNDALKAEVWRNQKKYVGQIVKYRFQKMGTKDAPRIPSFQGFRSTEDL